MSAMCCAVGTLRTPTLKLEMTPDAQLLGAKDLQLPRTNAELNSFPDAGIHA